MKKIILLIFFLISPLKSYAFDYTKSVEVDRISKFILLDSLLNHLDKNYIEQEILATRNMYLRFTDEFGNVYMLSDDNTFNQYSFFVKKDDPEFLIHSIKGTKFLPYNICIKLHQEVVEMLDEKFPTDDQYTDYVEFEFAKEPILENIRYYENTEMSIKCYDYINPDYGDNLGITVKTYEQAFWMREDLANQK